jgi:serine/threonine protein kinase
MPSSLELDFRQASPYFDALEEGEKLVKTSNYAKYDFNPCPYALNYSFIKVAGSAYAIDEFLGAGSFGSVKKAYDDEGCLWVIKIENFDPAECETLTQWRARIQHENQVLIDLGLGKGHALRDRFTAGVITPSKIRYKCYSVMAYEGESIDDYFYDNQGYISESDKLQLAISACRAVENIHSGKTSLANKGYAHLDLKVANMTIKEDIEGNKIVKLIDVGEAEESPDGLLTHLKGTPLYLPIDPIGKPKRQLDLLALKRCVYLPPKWTVYDGQRVIRDPKKDISILSDKIIEKKGLDPFFADQKTCRGLIDDSYSANQLAAFLVLAFYDITTLYHTVTEENATILLSLYDSKASPKAIKEALAPKPLASPTPHPPAFSRKGRLKRATKKASSPLRDEVRGVYQQRPKLTPIVEEVAPIKQVEKKPPRNKGKRTQLEHLLLEKCDDSAESSDAIATFLRVLEKIEKLDRKYFINRFEPHHQKRLKDIERLDAFVSMIKNTLGEYLNGTEAERIRHPLKERIDIAFTEAAKITHHARQWPDLSLALHKSIDCITPHFKKTALPPLKARHMPPPPKEKRKGEREALVPAPHPTPVNLNSVLFGIGMSHLAPKIKDSKAFTQLVSDAIKSKKALKAIDQFLDVFQEISQTLQIKYGQPHISPVFQKMEEALLVYAQSDKLAMPRDVLKEKLTRGLKALTPYTTKTRGFARLHLLFERTLDRLTENMSTKPPQETQSAHLFFKKDKGRKKIPTQLPLPPIDPKKR